jgi:signal transduction histidine kinase
MSSILVLADRRADRELLTTVLRYAGYDVHPVETGEEALRVARDERPDLIISDTTMPSMSTYAFVRCVCGDPEVGATTVVFCPPGHLAEEMARPAVTRGVLHFVSKSSDPRTIVRIADRILRPETLNGHLGAGFDREQLGVLNEKLVQKINELEAINDERRQLIGRLMTMHEQERRIIAEEIHDGSIQAVLAIGMRLDGLLEQALESLPQLERLRGMVGDAVVGLRRLLTDLPPVDLRGQGLASALTVCLEQICEEDGPRYSIDDSLEHQPAEPTRTVLYRAAREALTNAHKHADASRIDVVLKEHEGGFTVIVSDDGRGFAPEPALRLRPGHLGLPALRERVESAGGSLMLRSRPGAGSQVEIWLPRLGAA